MSADPKVNTKQIQKNSALKKCFQAIVDRKKVNINMLTLKKMLEHELRLDMRSVQKDLKSILPLMLVIYIRNWPGWQRSVDYFTGNLTFRDWFVKFRHYVTLKLHSIICNGYKKALEEIAAEKLQQPDKSTHIEEIPSDSIAPFCLSVEYSPNTVDLVFTRKRDTVFLKLHANDTGHFKPSFKQLLNWPYVGVEFVTPDLSFVRFNEFEIDRFIHLNAPKTTCDRREVIEELEIINTSAGQTTFSLNVLWAYIFQYMSLMRSYVIMENKEYLDRLEYLFEEFLKDIDEWDMNYSIASNTSVLFNIGNQTYERNKVLLDEVGCRPNASEITFKETIIPKIKTRLLYFKDTMDDSVAEDISFTFLNDANKRLENKEISIAKIFPYLTFHCLLCHVNYNNSNELAEHIASQHVRESNVTCSECQKPFEVETLALNRWKHDCNISSTKD
ncbi:unnamed protein product [Phyllotreta striolata]|uniref:C2H2-type domain-containing protein n=1 Tax=Phyllotreta striolata TaxID=444603 RepID=A0A9N9TD83_PHYSR|nr:unnamed protein product [Phyllotreta striolata]